MRRRIIILLGAGSPRGSEKGNMIRYLQMNKDGQTHLCLLFNWIPNAIGGESLTSCLPMMGMIVRTQYQERKRSTRVRQRKGRGVESVQECVGQRKK